MPPPATAQPSLPLYVAANLGFGASALLWSVAAEQSQPLVAIPLGPGNARSYVASADRMSEAMLYATVVGAGLTPFAAALDNHSVMAAVDIMQATLLAYAAKAHLKRMFPRRRPYAVGTSSSADWSESTDERLQSFPSGHATIVWAAVSAATLHVAVDAMRAPQATLRPQAIAVGLTAAGAVVTSVLRIVSGSHYAGDVIAGAAVGCAVGASVVLLNGGFR